MPTTAESQQAPNQAEESSSAGPKLCHDTMVADTKLTTTTATAATTTELIQGVLCASGRKTQTHTRFVNPRYGRHSQLNNIIRTVLAQARYHTKSKTKSYAKPCSREARGNTGTGSLPVRVQYRTKRTIPRARLAAGAPAGPSKQNMELNLKPSRVKFSTLVELIIPYLDAYATADRGGATRVPSRHRYTNLQ
ncbi:hypothetical protein C7212DRAFT_340746 [Tuber magnatum]|uniref:Uncharacterized protein n=1 Tax=Tuber magnatum TaxID=42249 RepID=A0A317T0E6_9PEZI|nr:hypothetical protein C7212DRAFT_340746 [Tuber magnatum]